jgi:hypothetical protein
MAATSMHKVATTPKAAALEESCCIFRPFAFAGPKKHVLKRA